MHLKRSTVLWAGLFLGTMSCSRTDQDQARHLRTEAREDAQKLKRQVDKSVNDAGVRMNTPQAAEDKLRDATDKVKRAAKKAERKLDSLSAPTDSATER